MRYFFHILFCSWRCFAKYAKTTFYLCVCMFSCMQVQCAGTGERTTCGVILQAPSACSHLFIIHRVFHRPRTHQVDYPGQPVNSRESVCFSSIGIRSICHHDCFCSVGSENLAQVPLLGKRASSWLSHLTSPEMIHL